MIGVISRALSSMTSTWPSVLLLVLGAFYVLAPIADIASDHASGLPANHHAAFQKLGGTWWTAAMSSAPGVAKYVTQLEYGYARGIWPGNWKPDPIRTERQSGWPKSRCAR